MAIFLLLKGGCSRKGSQSSLENTCWFLIWFAAADFICPVPEANELVRLGLKPRELESLSHGPWRAGDRRRRTACLRTKLTGKGTGSFTIL